MRFINQNILITGAGSGIGRATAQLFAMEGARVLAMDCSEAVLEVAETHDNIGAIKADAGCEDDVAQAVANAVEQFGGLDVLVANAGISGGSPALFDQDADAFAELLRINLIGPYLAIKHGGPHMIRRGRGAIICTSSVAGLRAGAGSLAYSASKAGVISLVQTAAQQFTGTGVRVNAVCPGFIETGMTRTVYEHARAVGKVDRIGALTPAQRGGEPAEIANAIAFLASDDASYINGHALVIDGGLSSSHPFNRPRTPEAPLVRL